jgi:hypothetical protein
VPLFQGFAAIERPMIVFVFGANPEPDASGNVADTSINSIASG